MSPSIDLPAKPSISRKKPTGRGNAPAIDLLTRSKARNLYVLRQLSAQEVADATGLTTSQVYSLATRESWGKTRVLLKEKEKALALAREEQTIGEMVEAVAIKSQVLSLGSLDAAIEELGNKGEDYAKNLQMLSVASKNFVGLYRQAKQLDAPQQGEGSSTTNVFFLSSLTPAPRILKDATPAAGPAQSPAVPASPECIDVATTSATPPPPPPTPAI